MKSTYIASTTVTNALRSEILRMQTRLADLQKEATTGRHADVGLRLGRDTSQAVNLRGDAARLSTNIDLNTIAATRLELTQDTLTAIDAIANDFVATLVGARGASNGQTIARDAARAAMESLIDRLNTAHNGQHLFAGIDTAVQPLTAYFSTPASTAKAAVDAAFLAAFGIAQNDPDAINIASGAMTAFIDGNFAQLFADPDWGTLWSAASDQRVASRIEPDRLIDTSVGGNAPAFRKLMQAFAMVSELGTGNLSQGTFEAVIDKALATAGSAQLDLGGLRSTLGVAQNLVKQATERMEKRESLIEIEIGKREGVDRYEAATELNNVITQLEASYELTARIGQLSLLNYL
jgi:flagellar hook-associated protein 3 FlgL